MAHLDRDEEHLVEREEHGDLDQDGQAARQGIGAFPLVERHHLLVQALLVLAEALAQLDQLRMQLPHLGHGAVGLVGQGEEDDLDDHRHDQDRDAEVAGQLAEIAQHVEERLGQEVEPAEVDRQVEAVHRQRVTVVVQPLDHLGAGEEAAGLLQRAAGRNRRPFVEEVGLVLAGLALAAIDEARVDPLLLVGNGHDLPVLVGDPDPAARGLLLDHPLFLDVVVVELLQDPVEHPDQALVEDVEAEDVGVAGARDQAVGRQRDRRFALVDHPLGDREHVVPVDLDDLLEADALLVGPLQGDRLVDRQGVPVGAPQGLSVRQVELPVARRPAEAREVGPGRAQGRQEVDVGALRIDRLPVALQRQVVEAAADQRDRAPERFGLDGDARPGRERVLAAHPGAGLCPGRGRRAGRRGDIADVGLGHHVRVGPRRTLLGLLGLLLLEQLLALGALEQDLEGDQDRQRQNDREDEVAIVDHSRRSPRAGPG